ncbi:S41 family peptidase [Longimicrobium terrae]|uniref:Carboxyl-terminal processing protease n=1 Tax=Longimicrobium terrae TaxID=1639882 RepID=A0A841GMY7_9BACT|nr:S41 family peptidase [Longimicrobium terrae]MBB4635603.1 carboxyl-terminal processing protease [Longimicrobium terrae]MBB6069997.1 carboxyl-terminal processing protease [Longimicrobium terrae]NNC32907.1 hypothetical protein [Longimicrobium terrae]
MKRTITAAACLLLAGCAGTAATARTPAPEARSLSPELAAATFDSTWSAVNRTFWDTTFNGVNWNAVRDTLRPRALAARSNPELRVVLSDMLHTLGQSHFGIIPGGEDAALAAGGPRAEGAPGEAGMEVRWDGARFLVTRVEPGGAADAAGIRTGYAIRSAGEIDAAHVATVVPRLPGGTDPHRAAFYAWGAMNGVLSGLAGDTLRVRGEDGAGRAVDAVLTLRPIAGQLARFGNLPPMAVRVEQDTLRSDGATVGVIRFNIWLPAAIGALDRAVNDLRGSDGIVIDLRGNVGGVGAMAPGWAGHFINRRDTLGAMITRRDTLQFVINPRLVNPAGERVQPYAGPVAVLTDEITGSTSEIFAGGLQALGRVRVFGATSAGQALPAAMPRLPNGDVLLHAIADMKGPGGVRWEARGVVPDAPAPVTRAALLAGGDPALDAAVAWIAEQNRSRARTR